MSYELFMKKQGSGAKTIVLLHGQISTHRFMSQVASLLSKNFTVYSLDLLGFGDSPRPKDSRYDLDEHVESVLYTLSRAKVVSPYTLLGHSMGAQIALQIACQQPRSITKLYLSSLPLLDKKGGIKQMTNEFPWARYMNRGGVDKVLCRWHEKHEVLAGILGKALGSRIYSHYPGYIMEDIMKHSWESYSRSMQDTVFAFKTLPSLKSLAVPAIAFFGTKDKIAPDAKAFVAKAHNPSIRVVMIETGHNIPVEFPEVIAEEINRSTV